MQNGALFTNNLVSQIHICTSLKEQIQDLLLQKINVIGLQQCAVACAVPFYEDGEPFRASTVCRWPCLTNDSTQPAVQLGFFLEAAYAYPHATLDGHFRLAQLQAQVQWRQIFPITPIYIRLGFYEKSCCNDIAKFGSIVQWCPVAFWFFFEGRAGKAWIVIHVSILQVHVNLGANQQSYNLVLPSQDCSVERRPPGIVWEARICIDCKQFYNALLP
mmetsp:Transcript_110789/g.213394  ORF Transcript_110789/g.213394 Transcript_110789/m.213394 type:complete len:217 (+) Transcript_110789:743-1393(+)